LRSRGHITIAACFSKDIQPFDLLLSSSKRAAKPLSIFLELIDPEYPLQNQVINLTLEIKSLAEKYKEAQGKT